MFNPLYGELDVAHWLKLLASLGVVYLTWKFVAKTIATRKISREASAVAKAKKEQTQKPLPQCSLTEHEKQEILGSSAVALAAGIKRGRWSSYDIVLLYCHKAQEADRLYNCLTESFFEEALAQAARCDAEVKSARGSRPLHGVPISVKEEFYVAGGISTCGCLRNYDNRSTEHGLIVKLLTEQGAIVICHTNVPQLLMTFETDNRMWGRACNPWNPLRAVGGSSGGEGALIAANGSPLGIGSDIGGSIRIPSHMCGICGFKPTPGRITSQGDFEGAPIQRGIAATAGPMARHCDDLEVALRCFFEPASSDLVDYTVPPLGFRNDLFNSDKRLKIGYFTTCSEFPAAECCRRSVRMSVDALAAAGHVVQEWNPPTPEKVFDLAIGMFASDGLDSAHDTLGVESLLPCYLSFDIVANIPRVVKRPLIALLKLLGLKQTARLVSIINRNTVYEVQQMHHELEVYRLSVLDSMKKDGIDVVVCPAFGVPAILHGTSGDLTEVTWYTLFLNAVHFPAGMLPVTTVAAHEQVYDGIYTMEWSRRSLIQNTMKNSEGLPIGVQVFGKPYCDEQVLRVMKMIQTALPPPKLPKPVQK